MSNNDGEHFLNKYEVEGRTSVLGPLDCLHHQQLCEWLHKDLTFPCSHVSVNQQIRLATPVHHQVCIIRYHRHRPPVLPSVHMHVHGQQAQYLLLQHKAKAPWKPSCFYPPLDVPYYCYTMAHGIVLVAMEFLSCPLLPDRPTDPNKRSN